MKYKCTDCGYIFEKEDAETHEEYHSEVHASEYWACCPMCRSDELEDFEEIDKADQLVRCVDYLDYLRKAITEGKFKDKEPTEFFVKHTATEIIEVKNFLVELAEEMDEEATT